MDKAKWTNEVHELLCRLFAPNNDVEKANLREWAETFADCDNDYFAEGMTPQEAVEEEMSAAQ